MLEEERLGQRSECLLQLIGEPDDQHGVDAVGVERRRQLDLGNRYSGFGGDERGEVAGSGFPRGFARAGAARSCPAACARKNRRSARRPRRCRRQGRYRSCAPTRRQGARGCGPTSRSSWKRRYRHARAQTAWRCRHLWLRHRARGRPARRRRSCSDEAQSRGWRCERRMAETAAPRLRRAHTPVASRNGRPGRTPCRAPRTCRKARRASAIADSGRGWRRGRSRWPDQVRRRPGPARAEPRRCRRR